MQLNLLRLVKFRNLSQAELPLHPRLNIIVGDNGSGKTSILEAIHFLGLGRSFRTNRPSKVVQHEHDDFVVFAEVGEHKVGLKKTRGGDTVLKLDGQTLQGQASISASLPMQLLQPNGYGIVDGSPKERRAFLDWGVFHVEQRYYPVWQNLRRLLRQRNALLKTARSYADLAPWDRQFCELSISTAQMREEYLARLRPYLEEMLEMFLPEYVFHVEHFRGWDKKSELSELLARSFDRDKHMGFTQYGAHKADLRLKLDKRNAQDVVSRGQLKLLVCGLKLAQGKLNYQELSKRTIYLVDDFAAELDKHKRTLLAKQLMQTEAQVFVTAIEQNQLDGFDLTECGVFHVEHGSVRNEN
ncbi:DNA replication/repair protein RecF [Aliagarivorans marinus]|uniref:DNA replication/repair protein RecF n=1 Tax=Aliagarivorans marinus TaxID=561965 RepID=UPI00041C339C|nr:DNA replication/repair protein RecF [Aliagarivorans marinus]